MDNFIYTENKNIFLPKISIDEIYTDETGNYNFIQINTDSTSTINPPLNGMVIDTINQTILVNKNNSIEEIKEIYCGTNSGNKPIKAIYIGDKNNQPKLIWSN